MTKLRKMFIKRRLSRLKIIGSDIVVVKPHYYTPEWKVPEVPHEYVRTLWLKWKATGKVFWWDSASNIDPNLISIGTGMPKSPRLPWKH